MTRSDCKILKVKRDDKTPGVSPVSPDGKSIHYSAVYSGDYPISRYLYCYTPGTPKGDVKAYLDWILGPEGQGIAKEDGYIPLPTGKEELGKK